MGITTGSDKHLAYLIQDLFKRRFYKLIPLRKDSSTPALEKGGLIEIADSPMYWTPNRLAEAYHRFHNLALTFGVNQLPDGTIAYNHCLDVDSQTVREKLEPYMPEIMKLTYVVVTKRGLHIHWFETMQHERIGSPSAGRLVKRSKPGYEFELKTDYKGGTVHLPGAYHRDDVKKGLADPFQYHRLEGSAEQVGLIDDFMGSGLGLYDWLLQDSILGSCVTEPSSNGPGELRARKARKNKKLQEEGQERLQEQPSSDQAHQGSQAEEEEEETEQEEETSEGIGDSPGGDDGDGGGDGETIGTSDVQPDIHYICADRIHSLFYELYAKDHRNDIMLTITGTIRRSWHIISLEDAEKIIEYFCEIAEDEELGARLAQLRTTYAAEDTKDLAGFGRLKDLLKDIKPELDDGERNNTVNEIKNGFHEALEDFAATKILVSHPNIEISNSARRHIMVLESCIQEIDFPQEYNRRFYDHTRKCHHRAVLLNAAPVGPIHEIEDPLSQQTKYKMTWQTVGENGTVIQTRMDHPLTVDDLEGWIRTKAPYYHKPSRLREALHAMFNACNRAGLIKHDVQTEIKGLVYLPRKGELGKERIELILSQMERPAKPSREQCTSCIAVLREVKTRFYSRYDAEIARYGHFIRVGVVSPIDFARRQSGVVNQYGIIERQDLGGWTDVGKTLGYAALALRMFRLSLHRAMKSDRTSIDASAASSGNNNSNRSHSHIVGEGSLESSARFIEQTRWTSFAVIFDEVDNLTDWETDREARRIISLIKNQSMMTNPRDTLTSSSELVTNPSAAYIMLCHNSDLIQEDGFNKRCIGHEFTNKDQRSESEMKAYDRYWMENDNANKFGCLGDFVLNYYLDNPQVLNNPWPKIAEQVLRSFWVDGAELSAEEFSQDWNEWLGKTVESATSKDTLKRVRMQGLISMFRQMIYDSWKGGGGYQAVRWIAINKKGLHQDPKENAPELQDPDRARKVIEDIAANATFAEKVESLAKTDNLPLLIWSYKTDEIIIDTSIVKEMVNRYKITRVSLNGLAALLDFPISTIRMAGETKYAIHVSLEEFVKKIAPPVDQQHWESVI